MPNRLIKESICTSDNLDLLSPEEERFFYRLIVNCDDYGRFDGRTPILRARLFPLKIDKVKDSDIIKWLQGLMNANLIYLYESEGIPYIQMITWEAHQQIRAKRSKYPDSNGNHMISIDYIYPRNPIQSNPNPIRTPQIAEGFEQFWDLYPKKKSKGEAKKAFFKIKPDEQLLATMLAKIEQAKKSEEWLKDGGKYIPYPATWLNKCCWEDEYTEDKSNGRFPKDGKYPLPDEL